MANPAIVVAGAGTAGLEGLLAARERFGDGADLCLIAPDSEFRYRPADGNSLFRPAPEQGLPVQDLAAAAGARWIPDRAAIVDERARTVVTRDGDTVAFDYLLLAVGGRPVRALAQGHVWERGGDPGFLDEICAAVATGEVRTVAVVVPPGARWPVPAYELALVLAWTAAAAGAADVRVTLLTAEHRPLGALGLQAAETVTRELTLAGVEVLTGVRTTDPTGQLTALSGPATLAVAADDPAGDWGALLGPPSDSAAAADGRPMARRLRPAHLPPDHARTCGGRRGHGCGRVHRSRRDTQGLRQRARLGGRHGRCRWARAQTRSRPGRRMPRRPPWSPPPVSARARLSLRPS